MKYTVCIISTVHQPFDTRIFYRQARTLADAGYRIVYLVSHSQNETRDGIEILALKKKTLLKRLLSFPSVFKQALAVNADVYHLHDPELLILGIWLRLVGRCVIYDAHEDYGVYIPTKAYLPKPIGLLLGFLVNLLEKSVTRFWGAVIAGTPTIAEKFKQHNVITIHNYPIVDLDAPRADVKFNEEGLRAIYVGDLTQGRGVLEVVQALNTIPKADHITLTVVGRFAESSYETAVKSISDERVTFTGWLDYPLAMALLGQSDVGLACLLPHPNFIVSWPNKLFEYMLVGLPIIASDFPIWRNLVVDNECGLAVESTDPSSIANALIQMRYLSFKERQSMGKRGQDLVYQQYNWKTEGEKLLRLYQELVDN